MVDAFLIVSISVVGAVVAYCVIRLRAIRAWRRIFAKTSSERVLEGPRRPVGSGWTYINGRRYLSTSVASESGALIRKILPPMSKWLFPRVHIPWSTVVKVTLLPKKASPPPELDARFALDWTDTEVIVPWREEFQAMIPESVGVERSSTR